MRLQTTDGRPLPAGQQTQSGTILTIAIPKAVLALPEREAFVAENPTTGIVSVSVTQQGANTVQIQIAGQAATPTAAVIDRSNGLVLSAVASLTLEEVVVTGERPTTTDYRVPEASTATKIDADILDVPQSIQVIPNRLLEDRRVVRISEIADNVSGVEPFTGYGGVSSAGYYIRGFETDITLRNGFRASGFYTPREVANIDRVEILKGPGSVLYGNFQPGGIVNTITEQPLANPLYAADFTIGSFDLFRTTLDLSGPLTEDRSVLYRLNAAYEDGDSFRDFGSNESIFASPVITWNIPIKPV